MMMIHHRAQEHHGLKRSTLGGQKRARIRSVTVVIEVSLLFTFQWLALRRKFQEKDDKRENKYIMIIFFTS